MTDEKRGPGRPSLYSTELADLICERLADGESLRSICREAAMPGMMTVLDWRNRYPEFRAKYACAREAQAEVMDDMIMTTAKDAGTNPMGARVQIDAYKWRAAKLAPKSFGDKVSHEHSGPGGAPIPVKAGIRDLTALSDAELASFYAEAVGKAPEAPAESKGDSAGNGDVPPVEGALVQQLGMDVQSEAGSPEHADADPDGSLASPGGMDPLG